MSQQADGVQTPEVKANCSGNPTVNSDQEAIARGVTQGFGAALMAFLKGAKAEAEVVAPKEPEQKVNEKEEPVAEQKPEPKTLEEAIAAMPQQFQGVVNEALKAHKEVRDSLVKAIKANKANKFKDEKLSAMDLETLQGLADLAQEEDYSGAGGSNGGARNNAQSEKNDDWYTPAPVIFAPAKK